MNKGPAEFIITPPWGHGVDAPKTNTTFVPRQKVCSTVSLHWEYLPAVIGYFIIPQLSVQHDAQSLSLGEGWMNYKSSSDLEGSSTEGGKYVYHKFHMHEKHVWMLNERRSTLDCYPTNLYRLIAARPFFSFSLSFHSQFISSLHLSSNPPSSHCLRLTFPTL